MHTFKLAKCYFNGEMEREKERERGRGNAYQIRESFHGVATLFSALTRPLSSQKASIAAGLISYSSKSHYFRASFLSLLADRIETRRGPRLRETMMIFITAARF